MRTAVASYLTHLRGVHASAEQIIIVNGVQQALDILARLLVSAGDELLIETPSYPNAFKLFRVYGADLRPLPVDEHGFDPALIPADSTGAAGLCDPLQPISARRSDAFGAAAGSAGLGAAAKRAHH
ncbi:MAG: aminotransferase class I/II-fold pyridoxal phosphate-dependent enzyme [Chloroflexi bacterium]|nr:aminotransferase class I/II-fold pyridoxal phosphate-dependent enzyme [Chloroflexota bacterium]